MNTENKQSEKQKKSILENSFVKVIFELLQIGLIAFVIVMPIRYFLFQPFIVSGESMVPSFQSGDYLIVDEISYRFSDPKRGDVVVFNWPKDRSQRFIKRIIGLPGETVNIANGQVQIIKDGEEIILNENYLPQNLKTYGDITITLNTNEYFVMGDNREYSYDSRAWGAISRKDIIGKAFLRIFPISALSAIF